MIYYFSICVDAGKWLHMPCVTQLWVNFQMIVYSFKHTVKKLNKEKANFIQFRETPEHSLPVIAV